MNMYRKPTKTEIVNHYKDLGYEVHVAEDGFIKYRKTGENWLNGRWIEEYVFDEDYGVQLV
jgi:hypothetical protein